MEKKVPQLIHILKNYVPGIILIAHTAHEPNDTPKLFPYKSFAVNIGKT